MNEPLLAKSIVADKPPKTLVDHTGDVMATVRFLYGVETHPTRLSQEWLRFFRLGADQHGRFVANTLASSLISINRKLSKKRSASSFTWGLLSVSVLLS